MTTKIGVLQDEQRVSKASHDSAKAEAKKASASEIDALRTEVEELQGEINQLHEVNRHMEAEAERQKLMNIRSDKAEKDFFNLEDPPLQTQPEPKSSEDLKIKFLGPRLTQTVGSNGLKAQVSSENKSPVPSEAGGNTGIAGTQGKQVDEKIDIGGWPAITGFRQWRMRFKKSVASASRRPKLAFAWITEVENAITMEELADSGDFEELDAKLSRELDKIIQGDFKKRVQVKETEYSKKGEMLTGRQITWMLYENFRLYDTDGALLEWDAIMNVDLKGDNLVQFVSDWESVLLNISGIPDEKILESLFRKQLHRSEQLKNAMALHKQDVNIRGKSHSYPGLLRMVNLYMEHNRLSRNKPWIRLLILDFIQQQQV